MDRIDIKTTENQLRQEFIQGYGYPPKIADALVRTVTDHIRANYGDLQQGGQVIYLAVAVVVLIALGWIRRRFIG